MDSNRGSTEIQYRNIIVYNKYNIIYNKYRGFSIVKEDMKKTRTEKNKANQEYSKEHYSRFTITMKKEDHDKLSNVIKSANCTKADFIRRAISHECERLDHKNWTIQLCKSAVAQLQAKTKTYNALHPEASKTSEEIAHDLLELAISFVDVAVLEPADPKATK